MPDAHAAAVEVMAAALCRPAHVGPDDAGFCVDCEAKARKQVTALVRSEAVRAALKRKLPINAGTDAVLAALAPPEVTRAERP